MNLEKEDMIELLSNAIMFARTGGFKVTAIISATGFTMIQELDAENTFLSANGSFASGHGCNSFDVDLADFSEYKMYGTEDMPGIIFYCGEKNTGSTVEIQIG